MLFLLMTVVIGIGFAFFAVQNTATAPVQIANYSFNNVPLYVVVLGSMLLGLLISSLLRLIDWAATGLTLHDKDSQIRKNEDVVEKLQQRVQDLQLENSRLRGEDKGTKKADLEREIHDDATPSLTSRIKHSFSR